MLFNKWLSFYLFMYYIKMQLNFMRIKMKLNLCYDMGIVVLYMNVL